MPDPQPKKPRWSQAPEPPAPAPAPPTPQPSPPPVKKPLPAAKPILPAGATPPPPTKPAPKPQTKAPPARPSARPAPLPTPPPPTRPAPLFTPPVPVAEPEPPIPVAEPEPAPRFNLAGLGAKLHDLLAIPGVPFAASLVGFTILPMITVLLFFPSRSAEFEVRVLPADAQATVLVNDRQLTLDAAGRARTNLKAGKARLNVTAPGYHPLQRELDIVGGREPQSATIELVKLDANPEPPRISENNPPPTQSAIDPPNQSLSPPTSSPPKVVLAPSNPPTDPPAAPWTPYDVDRGYAALERTIIGLNAQVPLSQMLKELGDQAGVKLRFNATAGAEVNVTPTTEVGNPSGAISLRQRLDDFRNLQLAWTMIKEGNDVHVLVTRESDVSEITVAYPVADLSPAGRFQEAGFVLQKFIAPNIAYAGEFDAAQNRISIRARWPMHHEIARFLRAVRARAGEKNALEHELAERLRPFGAQPNFQENRLHGVFVPAHQGQLFTADKFELLTIFPELKRLEIRGGSVTGVGISRFSAARKIAFLDCSETQFGDAAMQELRELASLQMVYVARTKVTDTGLTVLPDLPALEFLNLGYTTVSDAGLPSIGRCRRLFELNLAGTAVTDRLAEHLGELSRLGSLHVSGTKVGDATLRQLAKSHPSFGTLDIRSTAVTAAGLREIGRLRDLQNLSFSAGGLQAADLGPLAECKLLHHLGLSGGAIDAEWAAAIRRFKKLNSLLLESTSAPAASELDLPELTMIQFETSDLTDPQLAAFCKLPKLKFVSIKGRHTVTMDNLKQLKQTYPQIGFGFPDVHPKK